MTQTEGGTTSRAEERVALEIAMETLAEYKAFFFKRLLEEEEKDSPDGVKIAVLKEEIRKVREERKALNPGDVSTLYRALYIYAPLLKAVRHGG